MYATTASRYDGTTWKTADRAPFHRVDEPLDVEDAVLLDDECAAADEQGRDQLPQRDVEALGGALGDDVSGADPQVLNLGVQVVHHPVVLAHCTLRFARGARGEVDVGELVWPHLQAEVVVGVPLGLDVLEQRASSLQAFLPVPHRGWWCCRLR